MSTQVKDRLVKFIIWACAITVSYTHLDVYKRQQTGDGFQAALLLGLMAVSAAAILVVRRKAQTK